jgi:hypothetical protein
MKTFPILVFAMLLAGCTAVRKPETTSPVHHDNALGRASVVSMGTPNLDPHKPSYISWSSPVEVLAKTNEAQLTVLKNAVQSAIESQTDHKGYPVIAIQGDFQMQALLVLGDNTQGLSGTHSELLQMAGIDPGVAGSAAAPGKGSLVIELRQGHAVRWRGAVQIYLLPDSDASTIAQRLQQAVAELLTTWP